MNILGISCYYHDSAASIVINNEIVASCQEERFTRDKHTPEFPIKSIEYCLEESGLKIGDLDAIVFYDKPVLKFDRIISTFYEVAPRGILPFLKSMPIWLKEKLFLRTTIFNNLKEIDPTIKKSEINILFSEHHLSHAASAFYPSNFSESAILTIDAVGEWSTSSISYGSGKSIKILKELNFPNSVGLLYSAFTYYLGFKVNSGEYKLMGLAPYGNIQSEETKVFIQKIRKNIVCIKEDGSISLNQKYFKYMSGLRMVDNNNFKKLFNLKRRDMEEKIEQVHCNLALAIQTVIEEIVIKMAREAKRITNSNYLCLAGGVALNCVANGKIEDLGIFKRVYIQPASGDAGGSLGAALIVNHMYFNISRKFNNDYDLMKGSYLGPYYSDKEVLLTNKRLNAKYKHYNSFKKLSEKTASLLASGNVVGWFQGRSEFGPRALGNRSILADARNLEMQKRLNLKIKYRENFRPFAPSVLEEDYNDYFKSKHKNPYMLSVKKINESIRSNIPKGYENLSYWDKLYTNRSKLQAITHVDFSARIQSVAKKTNFKFWSLINEFKKKTWVGVLINTSFNVRGEPIVNSPEDAINCFMNTEMDYLVINNFLYKKKEQKMKVQKTIFKKD